MKNYILTALILSVVSQPVLAGELVNKPDDLENLFSETFYEAPASPIPDVRTDEPQNATKPAKGMPVFKKVRIKITNAIRERNYKAEQRLIQKQKELDAKEEAEENAELNKVNVHFAEPVSKTDEKQPDSTAVDKTSQNKKHFNLNIFKKKDKNAEESSNKSEKISDKKSDVKSDENTMELEGGVKEHVTSNDVILDSDNVDYDDKTMDIIATGSPVLVFPPQQVTIKADKMVYNKASNILKAYGNVEVIRDGNHVFGDYLQINMNEENSFMDNLHTKASYMTVKARKSEMSDDKITLYNGKMVSEDSYILNLQTKMIGGNQFNRMIIDDEDKSSITDQTGNTPINIKTKEIFINAKRDHDTITLKKAKIYYGDTKILNLPSFTAHTNKNHDFFEANYPEFGSRGRLGMFAGPGFVFDTPFQNGSTLKLLPILNNKSGIGFGGMLKYRSATNFTDMAYGSSADVFILKGKQQLDDKLYFQYGANSYMDEWFLGPRMPKYTAELIYKDETRVPSTIGEGLDLQFKHRFGLGYMQNNDVNRYGESIPVDNIGTVRTRYMAEANQSLFKYQNEEKRQYLDLGLVMQGSAALYGTGDTQFVGRIGPRAHTQYKYWMQDIGFFLSAYQDGTPMQMYDMYRYGHANVYLKEALRVNKYLTVAWSGSLTMTGDSPNGEMFQENSFIVALGPDDFKINLGYDWVRRQTYFSFVIAMDTKGSSIEYDKMVIKNPDRLAKSNEKEVKLNVYDTENETDVKQSPKKMMYAEVIDIEDPDREQI